MYQFTIKGKSKRKYLQYGLKQEANKELQAKRVCSV